MMMRSLLLAMTVVFAPLATVAAPTTSTATASTQSTASHLIEVNSRLILSTLEQRRAEFSVDRNALQTFVATELDSIFDRSYSARMVLGRHARGATAEDIALFADALIDSLLQRYGSALLDFNGPLEVRITSETALPRNVGVRVSSQLVRRGGEPVAIDYLLRQNQSSWKVFDIIIEGISMVQTFRQQFDAPLQRKSIREVADELRAGQFQVSVD